MRRFKFILTAVSLILFATLTACAHMTGPVSNATARILGRRIGFHGAQLYPGIFYGLAITADKTCQQLPQKGMLPDAVFSLIAKAIEQETEDPFLIQDLRDVIEIIGIDLDKSLEVINLTPDIQDSLLQFICSFAQGVDRVKRAR